MSFDHQHYVPCLRWKQGEYQAMLHLSSTAKDFITPLIEVPEIGFDFAKGRPSKSVDDHLAPFAERVMKKWEKRPCFVDLKLIAPSERMADGKHPGNFIFDGLRSQSCKATPVTSLDRDRPYQSAVKQAVYKDGRGLCLRLRIEDAGKTDLKKSVNKLLAEVGLTAAECDLLLDLGAPPNFEPIQGFAKLVEAITRKLPYLAQWRTFTIIGTSFPPSMAGIKQGSTTIPRFEWLLFKALKAMLASIRPPTFGDYTINHPDVLSLDMRLVKPSATIRYTTDDSWLIVKGPNVRDKKFEQYREHCRTVIGSPSFPGAGFSYGDKYIAECAAGTASTGNLTTWRNVGTNRHLEKVVSDISSFFGSSGTP